MRILHAHKYFHERDGAGRYMLTLMRAQQARGDVVAPLAMRDRRNLATPWEKYFVSALDTRTVGRGLAAFRQAGRALWSFEAGRNMHRILHAFQPDVVHVHNIQTHLSPSILAAATKHDVPIVMTVHDFALMSANYTLWDGDRSWVGKYPSILRVASSRFIKGSFWATFELEKIRRLQQVLGMYTRHVDRFIALSAFMADRLQEIGIAENKIVVIPPAVEQSRTLSRTKSRTGVRNPKEMILFVGRLEPYKGVATLIEAMRELPDVKLVIVGEGSQRGALEHLAFRAPGVSRTNVEFRGFLSGASLDAAYNEATLAVVPSLWDEPFGLVALEAMTRGVPVVVSDRGALPEIVKKGRVGLIFPAGDAKSLAVVLDKALKDQPGLKMLAESGRREAHSYPTTAALADRVDALYKTILS